MPRKGKRKPLPPIGDTQNPDSLYFHLLRFIQHCKMINMSKNTIHSREIYLRRFLTWCDERGLLKVQEITRPILERYQRHLFLIRKSNGEPLSVSGQLSYLMAIKAMFKWLTRQNYILYNPASDLDLPKVTKRLPKHILTAQDAETILNQPDITTTTGIRDRTIMEVLYSTGIRRNELTSLKTTDIDIDRGTIMVRHGKGDKDRMLPIGDRAISWIEKYLSECRPELVIGMSDNILFLNTYGEEIGLTWLSRIVKGYIEKANINKTGSCHLFRHTMATLMLENGADIRYIQAMLGHAKLDTTQIYTQVSIKKLKDIHTATHPAKNKPSVHKNMLTKQEPEDPEISTLH